MPSGSSRSCQLPRSAKCALAITSAGLCTGAIGMPRCWPSATSSIRVWSRNSLAIRSFSDAPAANRSRISSYFGSANSAGSPSQPNMARHWRWDSTQIRT